MYMARVRASEALWNTDMENESMRSRTCLMVPGRCSCGWPAFYMFFFFYSYLCLVIQRHILSTAYVLLSSSRSFFSSLFQCFLALCIQQVLAVATTNTQGLLWPLWTLLLPLFLPLKAQRIINTKDVLLQFGLNSHLIIVIDCPLRKHSEMVHLTPATPLTANIR